MPAYLPVTKAQWSRGLFFHSSEGLSVQRMLYQHPALGKAKCWRCLLVYHTSLALPRRSQAWQLSAKSHYLFSRLDFFSIPINAAVGPAAYKTPASKMAALQPEGIGKLLFVSEAQGSLQLARWSTGLGGSPRQWQFVPLEEHLKASMSLGEADRFARCLGLGTLK